MKKNAIILLFFSIVIFFTSYVFGNNSCPLNMRVEVTPGTCYDNGMVTIHLTDNSGHDLDTANCDLTQIRYHYQADGTDSVYYSDNNVLALGVGDYWVGVEALCYTGLSDSLAYRKLDTTIKVTVTTTYITPVFSVISAISNSSSSPTDFGCIPTLTCENTGRIQIQLLNGRFPYTVQMMDRTTGDTLRTVVFDTNMYNGTDYTKYDYKNYYSFDSLAAGEYLFHVSDACGYNLPDAWQAVTVVAPPTIEAVNWYYGNDVTHQDSNVVRFSFVTQAAGNENYAFMFSSMWQYRMIWPEINGIKDTSEWHAAATGILSDTAYQAHSYCDLFGKPIVMEIRSQGCIDTAFTMQYTINKPRRDYFYLNNVNNSANTVVDTAFYDVCGFTTARELQYSYLNSIYTYYAYYGYCNGIYTSENCTTQNTSSTVNYYYTHPLKWIYINSETNDTIYQQQVANIGIQSILYTDTVMHHYDTTFVDKPFTLKYTKVLIDAKGCELYRNNYTQTYRRDTLNLGGYRYVSRWNRLSSNAGYCCEDKRYVGFYKQYSNAQVSDSTIVRLESSPMNNKYNFTAIYRTATGWSVVKDSLSNLADIRCYPDASAPNVTLQILIYDYCLPSGPYHFVITDKCDTKSYTYNYSFYDTYSWEIDPPKYQTTYQCTEMKIKPTQGSYTLFKSNTTYDTGLPTEVETDVPARFQIISGPVGGYNSTSIDSSGEFRVTMPGTYVIRMNNSYYYSTTYCSPSEYYDTVYFSGGTVEFEYCYAYVCDSAATTGMVRVKGKNGTEPYTYRLYSGPNKTGTELESNHTGIFSNEPLRLNQQISIEIIDNCNASFVFNSRVFDISTIRKAWFPGETQLTEICEGTQINIYGISLADDVTYKWEGPNEFYETTQQSSIFAPRNGGSEGWYVLEIISSGCSAPIKDSIYLSLKQAPSVEIAEDKTICPGDSVTLTYTPHGMGNISYTIGEIANSVVAYHNYTGTNGIAQTYPTAPLANTYFWVNSVSDNQCAYTIPEDSILIQLKSHISNGCDLITLHDTICYDSSAVVLAKSTLIDFPQTIRWYADNLQQTLVKQEELSTPDAWSQFNFNALTKDTALYVTIENSNYCEMQFGTIFNYVNMKAGTTNLRCGESVRFYDEGGVTANYENNSSIKHTFTSTDGLPINISFSKFYTFDNFDNLMIFSGTTTHADSLLVTLSGNLNNTLPAPIESKSGSLTLWFLSNTQLNQSGWEAVVGCQNVAAQAMVSVAEPLHVVLTPNPAPPIHYNTAVDLRATATGGQGERYNYQWFTSTDSVHWTSVANVDTADTNIYTTSQLTVSTYVKVVVTDASPDACGGSDTAVFMFNIAEIALSLDLTTESYRVCGYPFGGNLRIRNQGTQTATGVTAVLKLPNNMLLLSPLSDTISVDTIVGKGGFVDIPLQLQALLDTVSQYLMLKGQIWNADQGDKDLSVTYGDWDWNDNPRQVDEDTVSVYIPRYALANECGLTANHVEVCYGDDALFMATASLDAPQYFKWYSDADLMHPLAIDTVTKVGNDTLSEYLLHSVMQNTTYYVTVENESVCPIEELPEKIVNMQNGSTMVTLVQRIHFYDSGGPDGNYSNNENYTYTFESSGLPINITFNDFQTENSFDRLSIFDGGNTSAPQLSTLQGILSGLPRTYTSTGNSLTLYFHSDRSVIYRGWDATVFLLDQVVEGMVEVTATIKSAPATSALTAISDSVCYDQTATLEASSALAFPQIFTWYNQDLSQVVFSDTVDGVVKTASQLTLLNQITDTTYFVTMQNASVCPVRLSDKLVNVQPLVLMNAQNNNKTTVLSKDTNELLHFYDSGWLTSYPANGTFSHTFVSQDNHIYLKFNNLHLRSAYQSISLYHGSTANSDSLIVTLTGNQTALCPLEYVSNGNQMTIVCTSTIGGAYYTGWDAEVTNYARNDNNVLLNSIADKQTTYLYDNQIVRFFDEGGINSNHASNVDYSHTFSATQGTLSVKFNDFYIYNNAKLYVYDSDTIDPVKLLAELSGTYTSYTTLPTYTSTGRNLTFRFVSASSPYRGFDADIITNFKLEEVSQADVMVYSVYDTTVYESTCQSTVPYQAAMGLKNLDVSTPGTHNYDSTFTTVHGCDSVVHLVLNVRPLPEITINGETPEADTTNICVNSSVELTTSPDEAIYQWSYQSEITGSGSFIGYQVNNQSIQTTGFVPANEGWYKVEVTQEGCVATDSIYLQTQENIGVPEVTNYFVSDTVVFADSIPEDINIVQYTPELTIKITDPIGGTNNAGCPIQYRCYLAGSGSFTAWAEWPAGNDTITIANNLLNIGYSTFQFRHDPNCTQICGFPSVNEYKYFISLPDSATQITADINESPICREQDSVRLTNIYTLGFNSANSIYEYKYSYYHEGAATPYYEGPGTVDSAWVALSTIGASLDDVIDPKYGPQIGIMIPNTSKISVVETPNRQPVLDQDIIRMSVRVKTIESVNVSNDTVWTPLGKSTTEWVITSPPTFITPLADQIVNYFTTVSTNPLNYVVTLSDSSYTDTIVWYWGDMIQTPNQELQYQTLPDSTVRFTYDSIAGMPQNGKHNTLSMYNFTNHNDTLLLVAGMTSKLQSCPTVYDTARVVVVENAYITKIKGDSVQALCQYEDIDNIVYQISGASHTAQIKWSPSAPAGIIFSSANDAAIISGTANEVGVFSYQVITIPSELSANSKMDTAIGSITVYPVYEETVLTHAPIIVCEPTYQIGNTIFTDNRTSQVTLHSSHGCDSIIMVSVFINHINNPDYYFNLTCPAEIYDTLPNYDCSMSVYLGMPIVKHHVGDSLASYYDSIAVVNNAPVEFTAGTHIITWTATDSCGNTATCEQMVYIAYPPCPVAVDYDENVYQAVRIDCDCWTQTNLKSQHYSDGSVIEDVYSYQSTMYPDVVDNVNKFGHLYTWYAAVDTAKGMADNGYGHIHGICPKGWYLPPIEKYESIARYGTSALRSPLYWLDGGGTNETGFSALPAGLYNGAINRFENLMGNAYFWSTTFVPGQNNAHAGIINYDCEDVLTPSSDKGLGYSIRCIKEKERE